MIISLLTASDLFPYARPPEKEKVRQCESEFSSTKRKDFNHSRSGLLNLKMGREEVSLAAESGRLCGNRRNGGSMGRRTGGGWARGWAPAEW